MIIMNEPWITDLEKKYVNQAMSQVFWNGNNWYWNETFRDKFAKYIGRKYCITTPSCTTAMDLLLSALDIKAGDEIITPSFTWIASIAPAVHRSVTIRFCDIDPITLCIDHYRATNLINEKTKAIIAVDIYGNMPYMDHLQEICNNHNIYLIEDAAEALGSTYNGKKAGTFGIGSVFSFHRTKTLTTGEGGALLIDDDNLYEKCMWLRDHCKDKNIMYWNTGVGYKYMPANLLSAVGLAQLERIDEILDRKKKEFDLYKKYLDFPFISFNHNHKNSLNGYWMTYVLFSNIYNFDKNYMIDFLQKRNIPSRPFFYPLTSMPMFQDTSDVTRNANEFSKGGILLPTSFRLTESDIKFICDTIKEGIHEFGGIDIN